MSDVKKTNKVFSPFLSRMDYEGQKNFDKYYLDVSEKKVFKSSGQKDENGEDLGVIESKFIVKKIDIQEFLDSQLDSVGVDSYVKALALQGESIDDYNTQIVDNISDYSNMPDTLAEVMMSGDKAKEAFNNMDPALRGGHTTIAGFLNSLTQENIDNYIKGRVEALTPKVQEAKGD